MITTEKNMSDWKREQLDYFRKYITRFSEDSREYKLLKKGIEELERSL